MFFDRLLNQTNAPLLEQMLQFTSARHNLILENIANVDTPGYQHKDLSVDKFQSLLQERVTDRNAAPPGAIGFDNVIPDVENPQAGILFHDGNNRSMETLQTDLAKNAMTHNLVVELLRKQYMQLDMALKEKIS